MRSFAASLLTLLSTKQGTEPFVVLQIDWSGGTKYYTDKTTAFLYEETDDDLLSGVLLDSAFRVDALGEVSSVNIVLDDTDEEFKGLFDTEIIEQTECSIWQFYEGLNQSSGGLLVNGFISGDVVWTDRQRQLSFTLSSARGKGEFGFMVTDPDDYTGEELEDILDDALSQGWPFLFGTPIYSPTLEIFDGDYVYSYNPSASPTGVYAYRDCYGTKTLLKVDSSLYSVSQRTDLVSGKTIATLHFDTPLDELGENWDSEIYVTAASTVGSNPVDHIEYIIENFSDLTVDATSFAAVKAKLSGWPANYFYSSTTSTLEFAKQIAFQACCSLYVKSGVVYIKFLAEKPSSFDVTINTTDMVLKSTVLGFTPAQDVYTSIKGTWKPDGISENKISYYKNNIDLFGVLEREQDFFIYNQVELVEAALAFWGYYWSNIWRTIQTHHYMPKLPVEVLDSAQYDWERLSSNVIDGRIEKTLYDSRKKQIMLKATLASKAGDVDGGDDPTEDDGFWTGNGVVPALGTPAAADPEPSYDSCMEKQEHEDDDEGPSKSFMRKLREEVDKAGRTVICEQEEQATYVAFSVLEVYNQVVREADEINDLPERTVYLCRHCDQNSLDAANLIFITEPLLYSQEGPGRFCGEAGVWCRYTEAGLGDVERGDEVGNPEVASGTYAYLHPEQFGFEVLGQMDAIDNPWGTDDLILVKPKKIDSAVRVYNDGPSDIPKGGALEFKGTETNGCKDVTRPTADSLPPAIVCFALHPIGVAEEGYATEAFDRTANNTSSSSPSAGDEVGTVTDSYSLSTTTRGFVAQGKVSGEIRARPFSSRLLIVAQDPVNKKTYGYFNTEEWKEIPQPAADSIEHIAHVQQTVAKNDVPQGDYVIGFSTLVQDEMNVYRLNGFGGWQKIASFYHDDVITDLELWSTGVWIPDYGLIYCHSGYNTNNYLYCWNGANESSGHKYNHTKPKMCMYPFGPPVNGIYGFDANILTTSPIYKLRDDPEDSTYWIWDTHITRHSSLTSRSIQPIYWHPIGFTSRHMNNAQSLFKENGSSSYNMFGFGFPSAGNFFKAITDTLTYPGFVHDNCHTVLKADQTKFYAYYTGDSKFYELSFSDLEPGGPGDGTAVTEAIPSAFTSAMHGRTYFILLGDLS